MLLRKLLMLTPTVCDRAEERKYLLLGRVVLFLLSFFSVVSVSASTTTIHLDDSHQVITSAERFFYYEDRSGTLTANAARELSGKEWSHLPGNIANFGFSESVYWFSFDIQNLSSRAIDLYVHIDYSLLDSIEFYTYADGLLSEKYIAGDTLAFNERPVDYPTFLFPVELRKDQQKQVFIRVQSKGSVQVPLSIWQKDAFLLDKFSYVFLYGCFLSAILIMSAYNLCLFVFVRERSYLFYTFFTLSIAGIHSSLDGFAYQWFWPNSPAWHQISTVTLISFGCIATVLFTRALLPIPAVGFLQTGIKALLVTTVVSAVITQFLPYRQAAVLNGAITLVTMSGVLFICMAMLKHSPRIARFYTFAWAAYFLGILLKSSSKMGLIPYSAVTEYAGNIGAVAGIIILALALADRINAERRAKEKAQSQAIGSLQRFQSLYENALEGIFTFAQSGTLLRANPAFLKLVGITEGGADQLNGGQVPDNVFRLRAAEFSRLLTEVCSQQQVVDYETRLYNRLEDSIWVNISARLSEDSETGQTYLEGTLIDITQRKAFEAQLRHLAEHDSLTGFYNRRAFESAAIEKLNAVKNQAESCCLMYMDLDQFKIVNDLCGHTAGDMLLKNLSKRLLNKIRQLGEGQIIARLGGDEFGVLLGHTRLEKARLIAEEFRVLVEQFLFVWQGKRYTLGVSIGLVEICPFHHSIEQVLVMADTACYQAKDQGRNRVHTFVESDRELEFRQLEMQWVSIIKDAIANDQFFLVFQNISSNKNRDAGHHYEILLRLVNSSGNLCAPSQFIPAAERYNLMPNIDRWVIRHYFSWLQKNPEHLHDLACASINISTQSLGDQTFPSFLVSVMDEFQIPAEKLCFEITEGMAITHIDNTQLFISKFRDLGCRFALDDFGTGFSSYAYLKELRVDFIKIDGVFIRNLTDNAVDFAMVKSICDVAQAMGIETVGEFVENEEIRQQLITIGIDYSQGYHIHKPIRLESSAFKISVSH